MDEVSSQISGALHAEVIRNGYMMKMFDLEATKLISIQFASKMAKNPTYFTQMLAKCEIFYVNLEGRKTMN